MSAIPVATDIIENYGELVSNHQLHMTIAKALSRGDQSFNIIGPSLHQSIRRGAWRDRLDPHSGDRHQLRPHEFRRYITDPHPLGLGIPLETIRRFLGADNPERAAFEEAIVGKRGGANNPEGNKVCERDEKGRLTPVNPYHVRVDRMPTEAEVEEKARLETIPFPPEKERPVKRDRSHEPQHGNALGYAHRRLRREAEDGNERARAAYERLKAGEMTANAAMVAAGVKPRMLSVPDEPEAAARILIRHFQGGRLKALLEALGRHV